MSRDRNWPFTAEGRMKVQDLLYKLDLWGYDTEMWITNQQDC